MSSDIVLRDVSRRFPARDSSSVAALDRVDLTIEAGGFVALVGPSGCGKSTILRTIAGLDGGAEGTVLAGGDPIVGPSAQRGIVFQEPRLFPWLTVEANVALGLRLPAADRRRRVGELLHLVGLEDFARARPNQLSGGMAQRTAIARALAPAPGVLLLDEPFAALDAFTRVQLQNALQRIWERQRVTALFVTHEIEEAVAVAQRVAVMTSRPGRIRRVVEIDLPYPRDRTDPRFAALRAELLREFALDGSHGASLENLQKRPEEAEVRT